MIPSLIDLPNSFQNFAYWPFFSLLSPDSSTSGITLHSKAKAEPVRHIGRTYNAEVSLHRSIITSLSDYPTFLVCVASFIRVLLSKLADHIKGFTDEFLLDRFQAAVLL